jgi:hypothetical protein
MTGSILEYRNGVLLGSQHILYTPGLIKMTRSKWAVRDLNPRPFDYQSNAPPS